MSGTVRYSVADVPTVGRFMQSDAFIRALKGPFGCLPGDTEFMSPNGWRRLDACGGEEVLCWDPSGRTHFERPQGFIDEPCETMIEFACDSLVMTMSAEHRVPHYNWRGAFQTISAAQMALRPSRRAIPTTFEGPDRSGLGMNDDLIRFAVMMHADGHYVVAGHQANISVRKERKKLRVRETLARAGIAFDERVYEGRPTESVFVFYPPYRGKRFEGAWWTASRRQMGVILDEIEHWDGLAEHEELRYFSGHKIDADFVQYCAHSCGLRATVREQTYEDEKWAPCWTVYIRRPNSQKNVAMVREHTKISTVAAPGGRKYCFTVSTGFFVARHRDTIFVTGNSGKSSGCVMDFMGRSVRQKPGLSGKRRVRWSFIRNTMKQLEDTTLKTVLEWFPPHIYGEWRPSDMRYLIRGVKAPGDNEPCEIEVLFRALDRPEHVSNLLSLDLTAAWINEVREIPWAIVDAVQGRVGRFPPMRDNGGPSWFGVTMDTNPPDVDSKFHRFFEEEDHTEAVALLAKVIPGLTVDKYAKLFSQPSGLSPEAENLANLPKGYYERMAIGKSKEWIKVYIHGDYGFDLDGKAVFPEYDDDFHCKPCKTIEGRTIRRGWDMGLTPACIFSQLLPSGQWIIVDELVAESSGIDRFSDRVLEHSAVYFAGSDFEDDGDPAGMQRSQTDEKTCFQILHAKGIPIMPGEQGMTIRLESVRKPLMTTLEKGRPQFLIHPRCRVLRRGFMGGYHYRRIRVGADRFTDEPNKNSFSHPMDALQYTATRLFGASLRRGEPVGGRPKFDEDNPFGHRIADRSRSAVTGY